jgi:molybdate transport system substrate-binding protein
MDTALAKGLLAEPEVFVRHRPVVIVPVDNPAEIEEFGDLAEAQIVLAEEAVPVPKYVEEALDNAEATFVHV